jgi:Ethanolamine utilization protein EutJ (predicted chaperonin)
MNKIVRKDVDPLRIATVLRTVTQTYMAEMVAKVNNLDGIDIVWLTGGACHLYASEVRRLFPGRDIRVDQKDPRFSNVRGFHMFAGETLRE